MSILDKYNKKPMFEYDNEKERNYINLQGLVNQYGVNKEYTVQALFVNTKSRYGNAPIIVTNDYMVNAPHHLLEVVQDMMGDTDLITLINDRKVGFRIYGYQGKNGNGYSVEWIQVK